MKIDHNDNYENEEVLTSFQLEILEKELKQLKKEQELCKKMLLLKELSEYAINGDWDILHNRHVHIDMFTRSSSLNGATFHEWLLTNPDPKAFELWNTVYSYLSNSHYFPFCELSNSAALVLYANLPYRFNKLLGDDKLWDRGVNVKNLMECGIKFNFNTNVPEETKKNVLKKLFNFENKEKNKRVYSCLDLACLHGYTDLMDSIVSKIESHNSATSIINDSKEVVNTLGYYIMNGDTLPLDPLLSMIERLGIWSCTKKHNYLDLSRDSLFERAVESYGVDRIKKFWEKLPQKEKTSFIEGLYYINADVVEKHNGGHILKKSLFYKNRFDVVDLIHDLESSYYSGVGKRKRMFAYDFRFFFECIARGDEDGVDYLLKRNPEWLEKRGVLSTDKLHCSKKGSALVLAVIHGHANMAFDLIEKGASPKNLSFLIEADYFKNIENYDTFMPIAEKILLTIKTKEKVSPNQKNLFIHEAL